MKEPPQRKEELRLGVRLIAYNSEFVSLFDQGWKSNILLFLFETFIDHGNSVLGY